MPFSFTCPFCHLKTLVDDAYAGSTGPCAGCGKAITLPAKKGHGNSLSNSQDGAAIASPLASRKPAFSIYMIQWLAALAILGSILSIVLFAMLPAINRAILARKAMLCRSNLKQIAVALNAYADLHGTYPPAMVVDSTGKPLYSWRVLILPHLGYKDLYESFHLDQPWDSATNLNLVRSMPDVFASPGSPDAAVLGETNYVLLTGLGTIFPPSGPLSKLAIKDQPNQTLLVVETVNSGKSWTAPGDIDVSRGVTIGNQPFKDIGGNHRNGANGVTVDGTTLWLPPDIAPAMLDALITPNGQERLDTSTLVE